MTCHITGPVVILDGTPAANRQLTIRSEDFIVNSQGTVVVLPEELVTYTDLLGEVSFDLMPGSYSGFYVSSPDGRTAFRLRVPDDTPTATFSSLLVASSVSYDPALTKLILDANEAIQNGGGGSGGGGGDNVLYIIPTDDMVSPHAAITAALASYDRVYIPGGTWAVNSPIVMPSNKTLTCAPNCVITTTSAQIITMTGVSKAKVLGLSVEGPQTGTSYQVILTDSPDCHVEMTIRNGNSGVNVIRSDRAFVRLTAREMRGSGIRVSGSKDTDVKLVEGRNVAGFGVYVTNDGTNYANTNKVSANKFGNVPTLTPILISSGDYDAATGRIGLEAVGITVGNDNNFVNDVVAKNTGDNGISITSNGNSGGNFYIEDCDHDGLHVYGSGNSFVGGVTRNNRFSGIGISQSSTTGTASNNSVVGFVSEGNEEYGVELKDIADNNIVITTTKDNVLGQISDTSTGINSLAVAGGVDVETANAQVSFVGVSDLAPAYGVRTAYFRHSEYYCDFWLALRITPTYTVPGSPGEFRISVPGLPAGVLTPGLLVSGVSGLSWPAGATQLSARLESGSVLRVRAQGPSLDAVALNNTNFPVGQQVSLTITGRYQTVEPGGSGLVSGGSSAATWGSITGTLSNQTDLNTALADKASNASVALKASIVDVTAGLAAKADTTAVNAALDLKADTTALALKANITDVLTGLAGKSDVAHTHTFDSLLSKPTTLAGYGITDDVEQPYLRASSGEWIANGWHSSTASFFNNAHNQAFWVVPYDMTITEVAISVSVAGPAGAQAKVTIYDAYDTCKPRNLLAESPVMDVTSTGVKSVALASPVALLKGQVIWLGLRYSGTGSFQAQVTTGTHMLGMTLMPSPTLNTRSSVSRGATFATPTQSPWVWNISEISAGAILVMMKVA